MKITFADNGTFETFYEMVTTDKRLGKKLMALIKDISRSPYTGIGKPEALKYQFSGWYSREITEEHRLVYKVEDDTLIILSCKFHYT
jgi:toxin YoeB